MDAAKRPNSALRRAILKTQPPSNYVKSIDDVNPCPAVFIGRESGRQQNRNGELNWQRTLYRNQLREKGFTVLRTYGEIGSGWRLYRPTLMEACSFARLHGAIVVAEAVNRFLRPDRYHSEFNVDADYEYEELEQLKGIAKGVILATILPPDMPEREVHGHQIQRGKSKPAPRGATKAKNKALQRTVRALSAEGCSQAEIKRRTGVPSSNISRWINDVVL